MAAIMMIVMISTGDFFSDLGAKELGHLFLP